MASVTVPFVSYQTGQLPGVCVLTGVDTDDRMTLRTQIIVETVAQKSSGRFTSSLDRFIANVDPRKPRNVLLGHLPVDAATLAQRQTRKRGWRMGSWLLLALVVSALGLGAAWSPYVATLGMAGLVYAGAQLRNLSADAPRPTLIGAGSAVFLDNVHERFVSAVENAR